MSAGGNGHAPPAEAKAAVQAGPRAEARTETAGDGRTTVAPLDIALDYIGRGWSPVPVPHGEKNPNRRGWQQLRITGEQAPGYFDRAPMNLGVILGAPSSGLVDVDLDCPEALRVAKHFLPPTGARFGRAGRPDSHWLYIAKDLGDPVKYAAPKEKDAGGKVIRGKTLIEIRSNGQHTIFPGSVHPSGETIAWEEDCGPDGVAEVDPAYLRERVRWIAAFSLLGSYWTDRGELHDCALALTGVLTRAGFDPENVARFVAWVCVAAGIDPQHEKRLQTAHDTRRRLDEGKEIRGFPALAGYVGQKVAAKFMAIAGLDTGKGGKADRKGKGKVKAAADRVDRTTDYAARARAEVPEIELAIGSDIEVARDVAAELRSLHGRILYADGAVYHWAEGAWREIEEPALRRWVHRYDGAEIKQTEDASTVLKLGKSRVDSVLHELRAMIADPTFFESAPSGVNAANGFIVFDEGGEPRRVDHSPDHRQRHVLAGRWDPATRFVLPPDSKLEKLLDGCFKPTPADLAKLADDEKGKALKEAGAKISLLQEVAGVVVTGHATKLTSAKAVILKGETAENGKSQVLDVFRALVPESARCSISPKKFDDERAIVRLVGRLLNAPDELGGDAIGSEEFKKAITGDPMYGRDVYRSGIDFRPRAQHLLATNVFPAFRGGMDRGVRRRLLVIPFTRVIPPEEREHGIGRKIGEEEPDLLLAWAVEGAKRIIKRGYFEEPESSKRALGEWIGTVDLILRWLDEPGEIDFGSGDFRDDLKVKTSEAYAEFWHWCIEDEHQHPTKVPPQSVFTQRVGAGKAGVRYKRTKDARYFIGMALKRNRRNRQPKADG